MFDFGKEIALCHIVASHLVGNEHVRHILEALQKPSEETLRGLGILSWVNQNGFCRKFGRPIRLAYVCRRRFRRRACDDRVQGQSLRTGRDPMDGPLVCSVIDQRPPARGNDGRARRRDGPRHAQSLGAQIWSAIGSGISCTQAPSAPAGEWTRPLCGSGALGRTCIGPSTRPAPRWIFSPDRQAGIAKPRCGSCARRSTGTECPKRSRSTRVAPTQRRSKVTMPNVRRALRSARSKYLNNIVEQDHRAIKRLMRPMLGFKSGPPQ
jgi:hypothetical protein